jgi:type I site-specific restriction endonuclease
MSPTRASSGEGTSTASWVETTVPAIVTTQMLTGVDVPTCKNVVIARVIVDDGFKQIGTAYGPAAKT